MGREPIPLELPFDSAQGLELVETAALPRDRLRPGASLLPPLRIKAGFSLSCLVAQPNQIISAADRIHSSTCRHLAQNPAESVPLARISASY